MTTYSQIVKKTAQAVYMVERRAPGLRVADDIRGTAFLVDPVQGLFATAAHVLSGVPHSNLWLRGLYTSSGEYAMRPMSIRAVYEHATRDIVLLQASPQHTKQRSVAIGRAEPEIGDKVLLLGFAHGTELTYCDDILGAGSPKSPTPLVFAGMLAGVVPGDGRPRELLVYDSTTFPGNSGGPVISCVSQEIVGMHIRGAGGRIGYGFPIKLILDFAAEVIAQRVNPVPSAGQVDEQVLTAYIRTERAVEQQLSAEGEHFVDVQSTLLDVLALERPDELLSIDWTEGFMLDLVRSAATKRRMPDRLAKFHLEDPLISDGVPRKLEEARFKAIGEIWEIHKNDADPFPSNPHAHNVESGLKLCLSTGKLYNRSKEVSSIKKKRLEEFRAQIAERDIQLPPLKV